MDKEIEVIFGNTIIQIDQEEEQVNVTFKNGQSRLFDLVIGADGLHSNVRNLVFGEESTFEHYYGYYTSSFTINSSFGEDKIFAMLNVPNKQVAIYSTGKGETTTFFIFASPEKLNYNHHDIGKQKEILKNGFKHVGWKCAELLSKIETTSDFYFDPVSQIKMNQWSKGRISLVGDACDCPSLLSGKGSTLAMAGAYILAGELKHAKGKYSTAFNEYENIFKPFIEKKQKSAQSFAKSFVPKSNFSIWVRNQLFSLMSFPLLTNLLFNQFKDSELNLKDY